MHTTIGPVAADADPSTSRTLQLSAAFIAARVVLYVVGMWARRNGTLVRVDVSRLRHGERGASSRA